MKILKLFLFIFAALLLSACTSTDEHGVKVGRGWFANSLPAQSPAKVIECDANFNA